MVETTIITILLLLLFAAWVRYRLYRLGFNRAMTALELIREILDEEYADPTAPPAVIRQVRLLVGAGLADE